jgi:hypothetical protein
VSASTNGKYRFPTPPKGVLAILNGGGLIPHVKKALGATGSSLAITHSAAT